MSGNTIIVTPSLSVTLVVSQTSSGSSVWGGITGTLSTQADLQAVLDAKSPLVETVFALTGTTPEINPDNGTIQTWTLTGNSTPTFDLDSGEGVTLLVDDGTSYTITWPSVTWINNAGAAPTLSETVKTVIVLFQVGATVYGSLAGNGT